MPTLRTDERARASGVESALNSVSLREGIVRATKQAKDDDVSGLATELAYRAALALLPFLLLLTALPSVLGTVFGIENVPERMADEFESLLSENSAELMQSLVDEATRSQGWTALGIGASGSLMAGTAALGSLRKALNRIYGFDDQTPILQRVLTEVGLTIGTGFLFFAAALAVIIGPQILGVSGGLGEAMGLLAGFVIVMTAVALLYWLAPAGDHTFRWVTPGATIFGIAWLIFSLGFSVYLSVFGTLNQVYGSLGVMIALLIWLYGSNVALLFGAEVNSIVGQKMDPEVEKKAD